MSATIVSLPDQSTARIPKVNFITKENGLLSWLLTGDHKRIAILYLDLADVLLLYRRRPGRADSPGTADAAGRPDGDRHL